jgi:hypothetical protein
VDSGGALHGPPPLPDLVRGHPVAAFIAAGLLVLATGGGRERVCARSVLPGHPGTMATTRPRQRAWLGRKTPLTAAARENDKRGPKSGRVRQAPARRISNRRRRAERDWLEPRPASVCRWVKPLFLRRASRQRLGFPPCALASPALRPSPRCWSYADIRTLTNTSERSSAAGNTHLASVQAKHSPSVSSAVHAEVGAYLARIV